jgi:hypothetical protein
MAKSLAQSMKDAAASKAMDFRRTPQIPPRFAAIYGDDIEEFPSIREMFLQLAPYNDEAQYLKEFYTQRSQMAEEFAAASWATLEDTSDFSIWASELEQTGVSAEVAGQIGRLAADSAMGKAEVSRLLWHLWKPRSAGQGARNPNGWLTNSIKNSEFYLQNSQQFEGKTPLLEGIEFHGQRDYSDKVGRAPSQFPTTSKVIEEAAPRYMPAESWAKHSLGEQGPQPPPGQSGTAFAIGVANDYSNPWSQTPASWTSNHKIESETDSWL